MNTPQASTPTVTIPQAASIQIPRALIPAATSPQLPTSTDNLEGGLTRVGAGSASFLRSAVYSVALHPALYGAAVSKATGTSASAFLLRV